MKRVFASLFILASMPLCQSTLRALSGSSYPYLQLQESSRPILWHEKNHALKLAKAQAVRVHKNGLNYLPAMTFQLVLSSIPGSADNFYTVPCNESKAWAMGACHR